MSLGSTAKVLWKKIFPEDFSLIYESYLFASAKFKKKHYAMILLMLTIGYISTFPYSTRSRVEDA